MNNLEIKLKKQLLVIAANNYTKTSKQIKEILNSRINGLIEGISQEIDLNINDYMEVHSTRNKLIDEVVEEIERYKEKEKEEAIMRIEAEKAELRRIKEQEEKEKELLKQAKEEIKEEERKRREKYIKIASIIGSIGYIIVILYAIINY